MCSSKKERETETEKNRLTDRHRQTQPDGQTDRQTDRQTKRQI